MISYSIVLLALCCTWSSLNIVLLASCCTLSSLNIVLLALCCTLSSLNIVLLALCCTLSSLNIVLLALCCTWSSLNIVLFGLCCTLSSLNIVLLALCCTLSSLNIVLFGLCCTLSSLNSVLFGLCCTLSSLNIVLLALCYTLISYSILWCLLCAASDYVDSDKISRSEYEQLKTAMEMIQVLCHLSTTPSSFGSLSVHVCLSASPLSCFTSSGVFFLFCVWLFVFSSTVIVCIFIKALGCIAVRRKSIHEWCETKQSWQTRLTSWNTWWCSYRERQTL